MFYLDSNTFIEAKNRYYHMDICPGYWQWMLESNASGDLESISLVYDELVSGNDVLAAWVRENKHIFVSTALPEIQHAMQEISSHVASLPDLQPAAVPEFLTGADPWLVAVAKALGGTVVTHEQPNPNAKKKIFIPDVCNHFGVPYIDTFELLLRKKAQFVLP